MMVKKISFLFRDIVIANVKEPKIHFLYLPFDEYSSLFFRKMMARSCICGPS